METQPGLLLYYSSGNGYASTSVSLICQSIDSFSVVVTYDVFLTLDREIDLVWKRGLRVGSIAYLLARYATPLSMLMDILSTFMPPDPITGISQVPFHITLRF